MEKNYILALVLSMLILFGYPVVVQWLSPNKTTAGQTQTVSEPAVRGEKDAALLPAQGPFLEEPPKVMPTLIPYENRFYEVQFSALGGTLTKLRFLGETEKRAITQTQFYEGSPDMPGLFGIRFSNDKTDLARAIFKPNRKSENGREIVEFVYEKTDDYRLSKRYFLFPDKPVIELEIEIRNLAARSRHFPLEFLYAMDHAPGLDAGKEYGDHGHNVEVLANTGDKMTSANLSKIAKKGWLVSAPVSWAGILKKYFAVLVKPDWNAIAVSAEADEKTIRAVLRMEPLEIEPAGTAQRFFLVYAGTQRHETLKSFHLGFEQILSRGMLGIFKIWLLITMKFFYQFTHNYGWALVLLTLAIKGLFTPLTHISYESSRKMQALQPKTKALQERYKNDPEKMNKELMQLWRRNKVNPMSGCLPMLIQMPILFAMFRLLPEAIELKGAPFIFWMKDLSQPDELFRFPFVIPLLGWDAFNLLPILMTASQYAYQQMMPQPGVSAEQAKIFAFMPVFFGFVCYNMPSGLVLYWIIQNLLSVAHQVFLKKIVVVLHHEDQA